MPWDGSGNFTLTQDFAADQAAGPPTSLIDASKVMNVLQDIAQGLMLCLQRGGQNQPVSDIRWASYKIKLLGRGTESTDAVNASQVAESLVTYCGLTGGTAAAITATNTFMSEIAVGTIVRATALNTNADNATLAVAGSTGNIVEKDGANIKAGRIVAAKPFACMWDGTHWVLLETGNKVFDTAIVALNALAQLVPAADNMPYFNGTTTAALTSLTAYARTLLAAADQNTARSLLGCFPAGTLMSFFQTAAPTGWTKSTTHNDKIPRIVSGAASAGGSTPFSTIFAARTIAQSNLPNVVPTFAGNPVGDHQHNFALHQGGSANGGTGAPTEFASSTYPDSSNGVTAAAGAHTPSGTISSINGGVTQTTMDFAVQYVDMIIASKN